MIRYLAYLPANLVFVLLAYLLSPFLAAYSVIRGVSVLPGFLQWFSTIDDTLDGGQHQHPEIYKAGVTGFALWWQRTCWIARNPAHGFGGHVLGFADEGSFIVSQTRVVDAPYFTERTVMRDASRNTYFSYRADKKLFGGFYLKVWFGWSPKPLAGYHQFEFQPFGIKPVK